MAKRRFGYAAGGTWIVVAVAILGVALIATATPAQADVFNLTSCHITGGCPAGPFGTVTLTQQGSDVKFDVVLDDGNLFVETGAGAGALFLFNDTNTLHTVTNITATLNGVDVTASVTGGLSGSINNPSFMADGTGFFTAKVECTNSSTCNGAAGPDFNDLHFTVTNATIAQLTTANAAGNIFVADILCGAAETGCAGLTGPVDVNTPAIPEPTTLLLVGTALAGLGGAWRRSRSQRALAV
jgi:hypothetical protein